MPQKYKNDNPKLNISSFKIQGMQVLKPGQKCPRCHKPKLAVYLSTDKLRDGSGHKISTTVIVYCKDSRCHYTFRYKRNYLMPLWAIRYHMPPYTFDAEDLFEYNAVGYRMLGIFENFHTMNYSQFMSGGIEVWLKVLLLRNYSHLNPLVYKILAEYDDYIHPVLVTAYIIPFLGFGTTFEEISSKTKRFVQTWEQVRYAGARYLFQ